MPGQWDPTKVAPIAKKKLWITVAAGDAKAYRDEIKIVPILQEDRATVSKATWNGGAGVAALDAEGRALAARGGSLNHAILCCLSRASS